MTKQKSDRPTTCRICKAPLPVASTGRVRYTCSARCRQIRKRYGNWRMWSEAMDTKKRRVEANKQIRKMESRVGSLNFPDDPKSPYLTRRERIRTQLMRHREVPFCRECRMPYVVDTWRKYQVCSRECYKRHWNRINYLDDWCWDHFDRRGWWDRTLYIREHIKDTICEHCGWTFRSRNPKRKYCCNSCKDATYWKRRPLRRCKGCGEKYRGHAMACSQQCYHRVVQRCGRCKRVVKPGAEILPNGDTRIPRGVKHRKWNQAVIFCSGRCRDALGWLPMRKVCEECREAYYAVDHASYRHQRFCSRKCKARSNARDRRRQRFDAAPMMHCKHCGAEYAKRRTVGREFRYCSETCRRLAHNERQRKWVQAQKATKAIAIHAEWLMPERVGELHQGLGYTSIEADLALVGDQ